MTLNTKPERVHVLVATLKRAGIWDELCQRHPWLTKHFHPILTLPTDSRLLQDIQELAKHQQDLGKAES